MANVGFEPTPFQTSALNWRLRPLGQLTIGKPPLPNTIHKLTPRPKYDNYTSTTLTTPTFHRHQTQNPQTMTTRSNTQTPTDIVSKYPATLHSRYITCGPSTHYLTTHSTAIKIQPSFLSSSRTLEAECPCPVVVNTDDATQASVFVHLVVFI